MTLHGHIHDGKIVLDHHGALPEGAVVHVEIVAPQSGSAAPTADAQPTTLAERYKDVIGSVPNLPSDLSVNLDHYLYGVPKRQ
jgi:hypothetical protein